MQTYSLLEASSGKSSTMSGQLDLYSQMSGQLDIWKNAIEQAANSQMYPPGRGIWWPRALQHKVILTFSC